MKPGKYYDGPIEEIEPTYGSPYRMRDYCPRCSHSDIKKVKTTEDSEGHKVICYRCNTCGCNFCLPANPYHHRYNRNAKYKMSGYFADDEDKVYGRNEIKDEAYHAIMDHRDHHSVTETAYRLYEDMYLPPGDEDPDGEWMSDLEGDAPWVEADHMQWRGYLDEMKVGESYQFPDFDLKVTRVANARPIPKKRMVKKAPAKKVAAKKPIAKKTTQKKAPARKPTKSATKRK